MKGAPKEVLALCTSLPGGRAGQPMTDAWREQILAANDDLRPGSSARSGVARRTLPERPDGYTVDWVERELTFLGFWRCRIRRVRRWPRR